MVKSIELVNTGTNLTKVIISYYYLGFTFNAKKSCCFIIGADPNRINLPDMHIQNGAILWVNECKYLGLVLVSGRKFTCRLEDQRRRFCKAVNSVICNGKGLSEEILLSVIRAQCLPILMYSSEVWRCNMEELRKVSVSYNNAIRRIFGFKKFESVKEIISFCNMLPCDLQIDLNKCNLIKQLECSDRNILRCAYKLWSNSDEFWNIARKYDLRCINRGHVQSKIKQFLYMSLENRHNL